MTSDFTIAQGSPAPRVDEDRHQPLVVSVVLNTNRRDDTLMCLDSLEESTYGDQTAIVLDNQSTDGSVEAIRTHFPEVAIVSLDQNLGYAGNNNVGIEAAVARGAEWIFVLNEDTVVAPDCIEKLVATGESDPRIGILGPTVLHYDEPTVIQSAGGRLTRYWNSVHLSMNEPDRASSSSAKTVDWISGCGILVRRRVIEEVGMLDPRYFYYWEETEWCMRASAAGWKVCVVPDARIWHKGVQRNYRPGPHVTYYATRNRLLTLQKHRASLAVRAVAWGQLVRTLASWTVRPKWKGMRKHRRAMALGAVDFLRGRFGGPVRL